MTDADADDATDGAALDGLAVERALDIVVEDDDNPDEVRETLGIVAENGVVSREAVDDAIGNASMVVSTAETRVELAADKIDSAREAATAVSDIAFVSGRVDNFEARVDAIEQRADDLGTALQAVVEMKADGDLYEIARRIRRVTNAATELQRAADDFQLGLDSFEDWLTNPDRRVEELADDVDALADSVSELDDAVENLDANASDPDSEAAKRWAAAMVRHRVLSLMRTDLRAELDAVRTWAERDDLTSPAEVERRLDDIAAEHAAVGDRLDARAAPDWTARFDEQLTAIEEALGEMEPPVVWPDVEAVVEEHRPEVE